MADEDNDDDDVEGGAKTETVTTTILATEIDIAEESWSTVAAYVTRRDARVAHDVDRAFMTVISTGFQV